MGTKANLTRAEAEVRAALLEVDSYDISLDLTTGESVFGSDTTIRFGCREPGAATFCDFQADGIEEAALNGEPLPDDAFDGTRLRLDNLAAENELRVHATCSYQRTGTGLHRTVDPVDKSVYVYTQFEPFDANRVFPCFDQPDLKSTFAFTVVAPDDWEVVSNGAPHRNGTTWRFAPTPRMSTYLAAVCGGPFHVVRDRHGDIDLGLWCRASLAEHLDPDADELFELTRQGFDYFEDAFGYPYPFGKYDQVFCPEYKFGAMENAGCVTFTDAYVYRSKVTDAARRSRAETLLHEMAHMWFGDLVTMRWWDDLWLNESFATYISNLALVRATRFTESWVSFNTDLKAWAYAQDQLPTTHPIVADIPDVEATHLNFDGITYAKGASVLKQLVAWVGEDAFFNGLKDYFRRHEYGNTELRDFLAALEKGSGRDLTSWAQEWLQTAGVNSLRVTTGERGGTFDDVAVAQSASDDHPTLRSHRVAVGLYDAGPEELGYRTHVEVDVTGPRTPVPELDGQPVADLVLPNYADLAYAKIRFDDRSLATLTDRLRDLRDPLARALCWGAAWDMVRDAELAARRFVLLVLNNVDGETDIGSVQTLLTRAQSAILVYGDPANRDAIRTAFARTARERFEAAPAGSDLQLAWASTAFIPAASSPDDIAMLRGLLDGSVEVPGFQVDTDRRWQIVGALNHAGVDDAEALVGAELERDPSDKGERFAASARASRPDPDAKAEAFDRLLSEEDLSLAMLRSLVGGFQQYDQTDTLAPYAERYFDVLPRIWDEREMDLALDFARGMYPLTAPSQRVLDLTEAALGRGDTAPPVKRILLEQGDNCRRALAARAKDASEA